MSCNLVYSSFMWPKHIVYIVYKLLNFHSKPFNQVMLFYCSSQATRLKGNSSKSKSNKSAHSFASLLPIIMIKHMHCSGLSAYEIPHLSEHFPRTNKVYPIWQGLMHFLSLKKKIQHFQRSQANCSTHSGFSFYCCWAITGQWNSSCLVKWD